MKKSSLTEDKAEQTPTGGVLVGKRQGQTIIHNKGTLSGYLVGKTHAEGGIKAINKSTGQPLEMQGGEVVITAPAVSDNTKNEFNGKMMTNREILSTINEKGGGVSFAKGGDIPKNIKRTGASYKYGGKTMTDHEIYKHITGGHLAEGMTLTQIAKKNKVSLKELQKQVDLGMKAESEHTSSKREQMKIVKDHLFENPKYYTLLKKAGLKHGGAVRRGSLVRDAKSGNTPARDLNNYNDMLDVEADGMVGGNTGLFANGGSVKPYDANMEGDSINMIYAKGGATDVTVNNWSEIPDSFKNVRLPKEIKWEATPNNDGLNEIVKPFLSKEPLRPAMGGINFDENGITATNAHILLTIPSDEQSFDGIYKKDKSEDGFTKIDAKYPNYPQIIPKEKYINKVFAIDISKLLTYCKVAKNYSDTRQIVFKINDDKISLFPDLTINFLSSLIKLTGTNLCYVGFQTNKKGLIFTLNQSYELGSNTIALLMPYVYGEQGKYGTRNEDKNTELNVYFDFDDNEIRNADGSLVDLDIKPTKQRAKRISKTTPSKTSKPVDLINKKIWIGDNSELSRKVQELGFANGFTNHKGSTVIDTSNRNIYFTKKASGEKYMYVFDYDRDVFDNEPEIEIFEADLFPTTKTATTETSEKTGKSLTRDELWKSKIWIGDNIALRDKVIEKLINLGIPLDEEVGDRKFYKFINIGIYSKDFVVFSSNKESFDRESFKEIFPSDLGILTTESTPTEETEKTEVFKLIGIFDDGISSTSGIYGATELLENLKQLEDKFPKRESFPYNIYDLGGTSHDSIFFGKGNKNLAELTVEIIQSPSFMDYEWRPFIKYGVETSELSSKFTAGEIDAFNQIDAIVEMHNIKKVNVTEWADAETKDFDIVNTLTGEVFGLRKYGMSLGVQGEDVEKEKSRALIKDYLEFKKSTTTETAEIVEQPKPSKTEKPKRNFELERKYLSQRISDLAKELDLKKPILSNEEVAFYQREINSFILKLRKLNDAEMSLKSIEERVRGVYGLKISSFEKEYVETDMTSINALKSQLTEKEYFNVRTPEFKSFFGDWETAYLNDSYAGVSKVINPITKEPQPVFHGTNVLFVDWKTYDTNNAHYFAVKREMSEFFATTWEERTDKAGVDSEILKKLNPNRGSFLLRCFIDIKNPVDFSRFGVEKYPIREYLTFLRVNYNIGDFDFWTNITSHSGFTQDTEVYAWQIIRLWQSFTKYIKVFTMYDGYIFYEYIPTKPYGGLENASLSYCAFDSNQIKFTDAYEFNALSNDSRFDLGGIL